MTSKVRVKHYVINTDEMLGKGSFGMVYSCLSDNLKNKDLCVKIISYKSNKEKVQKEIQLLELLRKFPNPNLITIYDIIQDQNQIFIFMDRCRGGDMKQLILEYILRKKQFSLEQIIDMIRQIILGYQTLIENKIIHRDLKPANILIEFVTQDKIILKLTDFGLGKILDDVSIKQYMTRAGTPAYMAPQIDLGEKCSTKCDIFSLGIIIYELAFLELPSYGQNPLMRNAFQKSLKYKPFVCPNLHQQQPIQLKCLIQDLINKMLSFEEEKRPSWNDLLKSDIMTIVNQVLPIEIKQQQVEIKQQKVEIKQQKVEIIQQKVEIKQQKEEIKQQKEEIKQQKEEIKQQKVEIKQQKVEENLQISLYKQVRFFGTEKYYNKDQFSKFKEQKQQFQKKDDLLKKSYLIIYMMISKAQLVFSLSQQFQLILKEQYPKFEVYHFQLIQTCFMGYIFKILENAFGFCNQQINQINEEIKNKFQDKLFQMMQIFNQSNQMEVQEIKKFVYNFLLLSKQIFQEVENDLIKLKINNKYPKDIDKFYRLISKTDLTDFGIYAKWFHYFWHQHLRKMLQYDQTKQQDINYQCLLILIEKFLNLETDHPFERYERFDESLIFLSDNLDKNDLEKQIKLRVNI